MGLIKSLFLSKTEHIELLLIAKEVKKKKKNKTVEDKRFKIAVVKDLMRVDYKNNAVGKEIWLFP